MKIELIKTIEENGEIYYVTHIEGKRIPGTTTYGGNIINEKNNAIELAMERLVLTKTLMESRQIPSEQVMFSEEI